MIAYAQFFLSSEAITIFNHNVYVLMVLLVGIGIQHQLRSVFDVVHSLHRFHMDLDISPGHVPPDISPPGQFPSPFIWCRTPPPYTTISLSANLQCKAIYR